MATRINKGPIKLLLCELVLVLFCLNKKKHEIFQADRNDYMVNRLHARIFICLSAFSMSACPCPRFPDNQSTILFFGIVGLTMLKLLDVRRFGFSNIKDGGRKL